MTIKEFSEKVSPCSFYETEELAGRLCDEGIINYDKWVEFYGRGKDHNYCDDVPLFDIIEEGILLGNKKYLDPYLDKNGEFDIDAIDIDEEELTKMVLSCVVEKIKAEFPKIIEQ